MNPYWINPAPDADEFLRSDAVKRNFYLLVAGHVVLWLAALAGIVVLYMNAQKAPPIDAFTARGEPAWGTPIPLGTADSTAKKEDFLEKHLRNVFTHLFIRTEKGTLPVLQSYTDPGLMLNIDRDFRFTQRVKSGYSQSFYVQEMEKILGSTGSRRRIYRIKGLLSSHSLEGYSNIPVYLLAAVDQRASTPENPLGWVVSVVLPVDSKEYYNKERQALIDEVTKPQQTPPKNSSK